MVDPQTFKQQIREIDFASAVAAGLYPGVTREFKFGHSQITPAMETDLWPLGDIQPVYLFPEFGGELMTIASTSALDTQNMVLETLDDSGFEKIVNVKLQGTTPVPLGSLSAINRIGNNDSDVLNGAVTVQGDGSTSSNVFAFLDSLDEQSAQSMYVIPSNRIGLISHVAGSVNKSVGSDVSVIMSLETAKPPNNVFRSKWRYGLHKSGDSNSEPQDLIIDVAGPSFKIKLRGEPSTATIDISGWYAIKLIDKDLIPIAFLNKINAS